MTLPKRGGRWRSEQNELTREKIQTTQIVKRLCAHILGEVKMQSTQIRAAEILLRKTMPDLSSVEQQIEVTEHTVTRNELSDQQWEEMYGDSVGATAGASEVTH